MAKLQEMKAFVKLIQAVDTTGVKPLFSLTHGYTDLTLAKNHLKKEQLPSKGTIDSLKYCNIPIFRKHNK